MKIYLTMLLLALVAPTVDAALVRFDFTASLSGPIGETTCNYPCNTPPLGLPSGTEFSGFWIVDTGAVGTPYTDNTSLRLPTAGKRYSYESFAINIAGQTIAAHGGALEVSETRIVDPYPAWPSGFSSDYTIGGSVLPNASLGGRQLFFLSATFSHDGNDLWSDFTQPANADFFAAMQAGDAIVFQFDFHRFADIRTLTSTEVPLTGSETLFASAAAIMGFFRRRKRDEP